MIESSGREHMFAALFVRIDRLLGGWGVNL
jgi:hypothetical protein